MATTIYPARSLSSPDADMLRPPLAPIPKCWGAEFRPLTFLAGTMDRLPEGETMVGLFLRGTAEGARVEEVNAPGYKRQPVDFHPHEPGDATTNTLSIVFRFEDQPSSPIPLIGLYADGRLVMRGGLTRLLVLPEGIDLSGPQVRSEVGALRLRFA